MKTKINTYKFTEENRIQFLMNCRNNDPQRLAFSGIMFREKDTFSTDGRILCIVQNEFLPNFSLPERIGKNLNFEKNIVFENENSMPKIDDIFPDKFDHELIYHHEKMNHDKYDKDSYISFDFNWEIAKNENDYAIYQAVIGKSLNHETAIRLSVKYMNYFSGIDMKISFNGIDKPVQIEFVTPGFEIIPGIKFLLMPIKNL